MDGDPIFGRCDQCDAPRDSAGLCSVVPLFHRAQQWVGAIDTERARRDEMLPKLRTIGQSLARDLSALTGLEVQFVIVDEPTEQDEPVPVVADPAYRDALRGGRRR